MNAAYYVGNKTIKMGESKKISPKSNEVQIKVLFSGICGTDLHIYQGSMDNRVTMPHVPGHECSGIVVDKGKDVTNVSISDKVVIRPLGYCGKCDGCLNGYSHICYNMNFLGADSDGCMQEYWTIPSHMVYKIPDMPMERAALVEPLAVACHDVSMSRLQFGETALVIGSGPIGLLIALVAREAGANVIISEINKFRINLARELGFEVINSRNEDLVEKVLARTNGYGADVVFEVSGSEEGVAAMTMAAKARGRIVQVAIISEPVAVNLQRVFLRELEIIGARVYEHKDYTKAIELAASGRLPLNRIVSQVEPLSKLGEVLEKLTADKNTDAMKVLIQCSE